jgi:hypothetical protein
VHDRHYGQQNINILTAKNGQKQFSEFFVTNSSLEPASYAVHARPVAQGALGYLGRVFKAEPFSLSPSALTLRIAVPGLPQQATQDISLELKPQERRLCQLVIEVPPDFQLHPDGPHRFLAVELQQERTDHAEGSEINSTVGTLGVVVFAETEA